MRIAHEVLAAGLSLLLVTAGAAKFADMARFVTTARLFLPRWSHSSYTLVIARSLALFEVAVGVLALALGEPKGLVGLTALTYMAFLAVTAIGYARYRDWSCNCFGGLMSKHFDMWSILRAVCLAALALSVALGQAGARLTVPAKGATLLCGAAVFASAFIGSKVAGSLPLPRRGRS